MHPWRHSHAQAARHGPRLPGPGTPEENRRLAGPACAHGSHIPAEGHTPWALTPVSLALTLGTMAVGCEDAWGTLKRGQSCSWGAQARPPHTPSARERCRTAACKCHTLGTSMAPGPVLHSPWPLLPQWGSQGVRAVCCLHPMPTICPYPCASPDPQQGRGTLLPRGWRGRGDEGEQQGWANIMGCISLSSAAGGDLIHFKIMVSHL